MFRSVGAKWGPVADISELFLGDELRGVCKLKRVVYVDGRGRWTGTSSFIARIGSIIRTRGRLCPSPAYEIQLIKLQEGG